jgi:23S rRNA pseudouridine1911/1915/1917 synthase
MKALGRQMLHAFTLSITHPITNKRMEFKSEMPDDMNEVIRMLDERDPAE